MGHRQQMTSKQRIEWDSMQYKAALEAKRGHNYQYWNDLADRFQDAKREYVKVTHWSPVPELPVHESKKVNRQIMLSAIADDEWLKIYYCDEAEEFYSPNHVYGLFAVSYDEILYVSIVNVNGKNNYMYATLTEKGRINRDAVLNVKKVNSHKSDEII